MPINKGEEILNLTYEECIKRGKVLLLSEESQEAKTYFESAVALEEMNVEGYINLGICHASLDEYPAATDNFSKALLIDKNNAEALFHLGNLAFIEEDAVKGIELYNKAILAGFPGGYIHHNLGMVYEELGNVSTALRCYSKAVEVEPLNPEFHLKLAVLYHKNDQIPSAIKALEKMRLYAPDVFESYALEAEIHMGLGNLEKAEQIVEDALERYPHDVSFHMMKIRIVDEKGDSEDALKRLEVLENMEGFAIEGINANLLKSKIYLQKGESTKAIESLESVKQYEDEDIHYESRYFLINLYIERERFEDALNEVEAILERPDDSIYTNSCHYYKAYCLVKLGRDPENQAYHNALNTLRTITIKNPLDIESFVLRVMAHKDVKQYEEALELVDYLLKIVDSKAEMHILKQRIYEDMGDVSAAQNEHQMAMSLNPDIANQMTSKLNV